MKILHNLLLGSLVAFSTTVLAEPIYLNCSFDNTDFTFSANENTGNASLSFVNGDSFAGKGLFTPTDVHFNARIEQRIGSKQVALRVSRVDLTFHYQQIFSASAEAQQSIGISSFSSDEKGTCSISKKEAVKTLF